MSKTDLRNNRFNSCIGGGGGGVEPFILVDGSVNPLSLGLTNFTRAVGTYPNSIGFNNQTPTKNDHTFVKSLQVEDDAYFNTVATNHTMFETSDGNMAIRREGFAGGMAYTIGQKRPEGASGQMTVTDNLNRGAFFTSQNQNDSKYQVGVASAGFRNGIWYFSPKAGTPPPTILNIKTNGKTNYLMGQGNSSGGAYLEVQSNGGWSDPQIIGAINCQMRSSSIPAENCVIVGGQNCGMEPNNDFSTRAKNSVQLGGQIHSTRHERTVILGGERITTNKNDYAFARNIEVRHGNLRVVDSGILFRNKTLAQSNNPLNQDTPLGGIPKPITTADRTWTLPDLSGEFAMATGQAYTPTNYSTVRSLDGGLATLSDVANVLNTLINDLKTNSNILN